MGGTGPAPVPARRVPVVLAAAAVLAVLAGVGLAALAGRPGPGPDAGRAGTATQSAAPTPTDPATTPTTAAGTPPTATAPPAADAPGAVAAGDLPRVAFLGDSLTVGLGAPPQRGYAWQTAERLGWPVVLVDGVSGSGFVAPGGGAPMPDRVPDVVAARPDVVVVAGGTNDVLRGHPPGEVGRAAAGLLEDLRAGLPEARLVVLGPLPTRYEEVDDPDPVREAVRAAAQAAGVEYLDAGEIVADAVSGPAEWDRYISDDGLHPNERGYAALADAVAAELAALVP